MKDTLVNKLNINGPVTITKKMVIMICGVFAIFFTLIAITLFLSLNNYDNYQLISNSYNELLEKVNTNNVSVNNINALEKKLSEIQLEQKKINVDYDNLNTRSARSQQDIMSLQLILNDQNLDSKLDNLETAITNIEIELDAVKNVQKMQQESLDGIATSFEQFKQQIIQKITMMLSNNNKSTDTTRKNTENKAASLINFKYQLSSIEFRSGELVAVFLPKDATSLSSLKFVNEGDQLDSWKVAKIDKNSVKLINSKQQAYTLTID
ncbi:hypothetical protein J3U21_04545 [Gilliamella sp. B2776]|uniref:hypothetical protein n=1 Tax=unclassified Gilliamella TaxID=2685620 RepID=UPI002269EA64|nr:MULTISPECIES: hypothetical protein [unclassified Gilliamella]MCX8578715.1 hypothetical protein [Gilliamella sp. B2717]MCX8649597.1 hypothetical protein [Gilliamella sp. B2779]MCX8654885.1 hypothetical protein [Gilliamella sp. B2737]MCX8691413.1 hypothetical protein [Gilliamella sp. B2776]MCX8702526.1 hypothetical protein [Gilliamella sp. B2781]